MTSRLLVTLVVLPYLIGGYLTTSHLSANTSYTTQNSSVLSNRLHNAEVEIDMLKKSIESQEDSRATLERDVRQLMKATKESSKETSQDALKRAQAVEKQLEKLVQDMKEIKSHSNDLTKMVNDFSKSLTTLEDKFDSQAKTIQSLEKAMRSLTMALKGSTMSSSDKTSVYIVKSGDSLEKIAKAHKMTVQSLKEINNLTSNTIRQGQELKVVSPQDS